MSLYNSFLSLTPSILVDLFKKEKKKEGVDASDSIILPANHFVDEEYNGERSNAHFLADRYESNVDTPDLFRMEKRKDEKYSTESSRVLPTQSFSEFIGDRSKAQFESNVVSLDPFKKDKQKVEKYSTDPLVLPGRHYDGFSSTERSTKVQFLADQFEANVRKRTLKSYLEGSESSAKKRKTADNDFADKSATSSSVHLFTPTLTFNDRFSAKKSILRPKPVVRSSLISSYGVISSETRRILLDMERRNSPITAAKKMAVNSESLFLNAPSLDKSGEKFPPRSSLNTPIRAHVLPRLATLGNTPYSRPVAKETVDKGVSTDISMSRDEHADSLSDISASRDVRPSALRAEVGASWLCPTCFVRNFTNDFKCVCCRTDRPGVVDVSKSSSTDKISASSIPRSSVFNNGGYSFSTPYEPKTTSDASAVSKTSAPKSSFSFGFQPTSGTTNFLSQTSTTTSSFSTADSFNVSSSTSKSASSPTFESGEFTFQAPAWLCQTCFVKNSGNDSKCVCCRTDNPGAVVSKSKSSFTDKKSVDYSNSSRLEDVTPPFSTSNKNVDISSSEKSMDLIPPFSTSNKTDWVCQTCFIKNSNDKSKCIACESENPKTSKQNVQSSLSSVSTVTAPPPTAPKKDWSCTTCFITNPSDIPNCMACKSVKPGSTIKPVNFGFQDIESKKPLPGDSTNKSTLTFGLPPSIDKQSENNSVSKSVVEVDNGDKDVSVSATIKLGSKFDTSNVEKSINSAEKSVENVTELVATERKRDKIVHFAEPPVSLVKTISVDSESSQSAEPASSTVVTSTVPAFTIGGGFNYFSTPSEPKTTNAESTFFQPPSVSKGFSFGLNKTSSAPNFLSPTSTASATATTASSFSVFPSDAKSTTVTTVPAFGSTGGFSFQAPASTASTTVPTFSTGGFSFSATSAPKTTTGADSTQPPPASKPFSFGLKTTGSVPNFLSPATTTTTATMPSFSTGGSGFSVFPSTATSSAAPTVPSFGSSGFLFQAPHASTSTTTVPAFSTGGAFGFSASSEPNKTSVTDSTFSQPPSASKSFSFGLKATSVPNFLSTAATGTATTMPSFSSGGFSGFPSVATSAAPAIPAFGSGGFNFQAPAPSSVPSFTLPDSGSMNNPIPSTAFSIPSNPFSITGVPASKSASSRKILSAKRKGGRN